MSSMSKDDAHYTSLCNMHQAFLEALRHREQDVIQFFAVLGPALGGFIWLLSGDLHESPFRFVAGTYGVLLVLLMGAFYSLALGYNYRYITLQLAKFEQGDCLDLKKAVLAFWPRDYEEFEKRNRWGVIPWSTPPGIIKVFWATSLACILGVTVIAASVDLKLDGEPPGGVAAGQSGGPTPSSPPAQATSTSTATAHDEAPAPKLSDAEKERLASLKSAIPWAGGAFFLLALLGPINVGRKMLRACRKERENEKYSEEPKDGEGNGQG